MRFDRLLGLLQAAATALTIELDRVDLPTGTQLGLDLLIGDSRVRLPGSRRSRGDATAGTAELVAGKENQQTDGSCCSGSRTSRALPYVGRLPDNASDERWSRNSPAGVRADIWLWAARFFKTRSLAKQAIEGGKVEVNGAGCKAAKVLHVDDRLRITRGEQRMEVRVLALVGQTRPGDRGPAALPRNRGQP